MNKFLSVCIFILLATSMCPAQSNQTESLTFTTYYPAPYGVYRYLKLSPTDSPPSSPSPGEMYYDNGSDSIKYNNSNGWVELTGGEGGGGNGTYWNRTNGPPYRLYNNNTGFVGIGTRTPNAPLTVLRTDDLNATIVGLRKRYNGSAFPDQYLFFKAYPSTVSGYLQSTSVIYTPSAPLGNLSFIAVNDTQHIRFNIGNFIEPYSEVMRLVNPGQSNPKVGIGTTNPEFTLQVDSNTPDISVLGVRGTALSLPTGIFNIAPGQDAMHLAYGTYLQGGVWVNDPYVYPLGHGNHHQARLSLSATGANWSAGNIIAGNNALPESGPPFGGWNLAFNEELWDRTGTWVNDICPPSSRKLKEKFTGLEPEDILRKIGQLEVSRWNYKSRDKSDHIGPIAEDFNRLFKTGSQEDQLHLVDSIGVSLAGVKALSKRIKAQKKEIEELELAIKGLRAQLGKSSAKRIK